jgi:hypothetical protein
VSGVSVRWRDGGEDELLKALRQQINLQYGGDVMAALGGSPVQQEPEWSLEALLLAQIEYRLARLEWVQQARGGRAPRPLVDVATRLRRLGLLPPDGAQDAGAAE